MHYSYDQMGGNTGIAYSGTTSDGLNKYFIFDSATVHSVVMANAKGRIAEAYTAATVAGTKVTDEGFSYTLRGEISDVYQWSTHSGGWYHTSATYFANGVLNTLAGISGGTWTFGVDGKGRANTAVQGSTNEVTGATFNAANQPLTITFGLGDVDTYTYDANTGRMASYDFAIKATPVHFTGTPSWNANGTVRGLIIVDGVNSGADSEACDYGTGSNTGYDEIGRLVRVNCMNGSTPVWGQNFTYDAYDNLKKTVPTGQTGTSWTPTYNAANNQYTTATYDSNGNLLTDTFHSYTWNQDNHLKTITDVGMTMTYDAFGRMVEKYDGTSYWQELFSPIGPVALMNGQAVSQLRVPLPGGATALSGINFEHKDWLGSASFVSNRNRTSTATRLFSPYGEIYNNTGSTGDVDFTGDRQDLTAGLYDTPNRELNPSGRWISPDPAHARWNAYSYSTNPLGETDPSGLGAAGVNSFSFGAAPGPPAPEGGGGDAVGLRQPDMEELAFGGEFAGSVWDFNFGMEGIYSPSMTPSGGDLCCLGGGGGTIGGGTVWDTGITPMTFAPGSSNGPACIWCNELNGDWRAEQQVADAYAYCGMADCFVDPGPPRLMHAWQEPPNATIQQLKFKIPITNTTVTISDSLTLFYANVSSTGDVSGVIGPNLIPSVGGSFDISIDAPEDPTPIVTVGLGRNLGVGTFITNQGPQGFQINLGVSSPAPVTLSIPVGNIAP